MKTEPRELAKIFLYWLIFSVPFVLVSFLVMAIWRQQAASTMAVVSGCATFMGIGSFLLVVWNCRKRSWFRSNLAPFLDLLSVQDLIIPGGVALVGSLLLVVAANVVNDGFKYEALMRGLLESPGGLFSIFTGIGTMTGVYLAVRQNLEFRQTITSFSQLGRRLASMLESTHEDDDTVRCLVCTPAIGCLALPKREWDFLYSTLNAHNTRIEMVCLDDESLRKYHELFKDRKTDRGVISREIIDEANKKSQALIASFQASQYCAKSLAETSFPGYYVFANRQRAIIVAPFFMPMPLHSLSPNQIMELPPVEMFGFETSDAIIVRTAHKLFEVYSANATRHSGLQLSA